MGKIWGERAKVVMNQAMRNNKGLDNLIYILFFLLSIYLKPSFISSTCLLRVVEELLFVSTSFLKTLDRLSSKLSGNILHDPKSYGK